MKLWETLFVNSLGRTTFHTFQGIFQYWVRKSSQIMWFPEQKCNFNLKPFPVNNPPSSLSEEKQWNSSTRMLIIANWLTFRGHYMQTHVNSPLDLYRRMAKRAFIGRCSKCNHKTNLFDIEYSNWSFLSYVQPKTVTKFNKTARKILQLLIWTKIKIPVSPFIQSFWQKRLFLFSHSKRVLQRR